MVQLRSQGPFAHLETSPPSHSRSRVPENCSSSLQNKNLVPKEGSSLIFIDNIPAGLNKSQVEEVLSTIGPIVSFHLTHNHDKREPGRLAFAEYQDPETAASAVRNLDNYEVMGRKLCVRLSHQEGEGFERVAMLERAENMGTAAKLDWKPGNTDDELSIIHKGETTGEGLQVLNKDDADGVDRLRALQDKLVQLKEKVTERPNLMPVIEAYERNISFLTEQLQKNHDFVRDRITALREHLTRKGYEGAKTNVDEVIRLYERGDEELCDLKRNETVVFRDGRRLGRVDRITCIGPEVPRGGEGGNWYEEPLGFSVKCSSLRSVGGTLNGFNILGLLVTGS